MEKASTAPGFAAPICQRADGAKYGRETEGFYPNRAGDFILTISRIYFAVGGDGVQACGMKATNVRWDQQTGWDQPLDGIKERVDLVVYFGAVEVLERPAAPWRELRAAWPNALCIGCSTAGEIYNSSVTDGGFCATLVRFDGTQVKGASVNVAGSTDSAAAGAALGQKLLGADLRHVLLLSDGLGVNGTALTVGLREALPSGVFVTGGLAGDGARFKRTLVGLGSELRPGQVAAVGFYGSKLRVAHGSAGGWQSFGPKRLITQSEGNVLYTLDDQPALELYKRFLGDRAEGLPATGLLFPLQLLPDRLATAGVVRTILAVDEARQSLTFAGDMPAGEYTRLMKAGGDALVSGADAAAGHASNPAATGPRLALLVSCVGRKLVLGQRVEEEIEAVLTRLGAGVSAVGFYSYGEICPSGVVHGCDLHNQTMTLTVFAEDS